MVEHNQPFWLGAKDEKAFFDFCDSGSAKLVETEDSYIYTLSVPNEKKTDSKILTVRKAVSGNAADREQEFAFTLTVEGADPTDTYEWLKNGVAQSEGIHPGDTFYLKHDDTVEIAIPQDSVVTVSEQSGEYSVSFRLNDDPSQQTSSLSFTLEDDASLLVTNTFEQIVPTGVFDKMLIWWEIALLPAGFTALFLWLRRKRSSFPNRRP